MEENSKEKNEFPLIVERVENKDIDTDHAPYGPPGSLVAICPCGEEFEDKTYLGLYLGDLPIDISSGYRENDRTIINSVVTNPAILIPELNRIIYGYESWWYLIETEEQLEKITDEDIANVWYVKEAKKLLEKEKKK